MQFKPLHFWLYARDITYSFMLKLTAYYSCQISFQIAYYSHIIPPKHNIDPMSSHKLHQTINNGHMTLSINTIKGIHKYFDLSRPSGLQMFILYYKIRTDLSKTCQLFL